MACAGQKKAHPDPTYDREKDSQSSQNFTRVLVKSHFLIDQLIVINAWHVDVITPTETSTSLYCNVSEISLI